MENSLQKIYLEESSELLQIAESILLSLEKDPDLKQIESLFRNLHTLKGNSSMFGFQTIATFLHNLENIFDAVRKRELAISDQLIVLSLKSIDHLKKLLENNDYDAQTCEQAHAQLLTEINHFYGKLIVNSDSNQEIKDEIFSKNLKTYLIYFEPDVDLFKNGTDPKYLFRELEHFGKLKTIPHLKNKDGFEETDINNCYTYWDIFLVSHANESDIRSVFIFVEDNSVLEIHTLSDGDELNNPTLQQYMEGFLLKDERIALSEIQKILSETDAEEVSTEAPVVQQVFEKISSKTESEKAQSIISNTADNKSTGIRVSIEKLDELMGVVSELITTQAGLVTLSGAIEDPRLEYYAESIEKLSRRLREVSFSMTLLPVSSLVGRFQRVVRDTANIVNKKVRLEVIGGEIEVDKNIIDKLFDPIMHMIRNCIDHGLESPNERIQKGKPEEGVITLEAFYSGVFVYLRIKDDGKGINKNAVVQKAIKQGLIKPEDKLTDKEIFNLLFLPGFSTAEQINEVSGRGVGMDVVNKQVLQLKGQVSVTSIDNVGTCFEIRLPLSLSVIDGLLLETANQQFILPLGSIIKCYEIESKLLVANFNRLILLDNKQIPYVNLREDFNLESEMPDYTKIILIHYLEKVVGICVDKIIGEYQAVIKPLGQYYKNQDFLSGASILGDGTIALALDSHKIVEHHSLIN